MKDIFRLLETNKLLAPEAGEGADTGTAGTDKTEPTTPTEPTKPENILAGAGEEAGEGEQNPTDPTPAEKTLETVLTGTAGKPGEDVEGAKAQDGQKTGKEGSDPEEIKGVDGMEYMDGELSELNKLCKEHNITPKAANAVLAWQAKFAQASAEKQQQATVQDIQNYVREESEKNLDLVRKEWGADKATIAANEAACALAMRKFADDDLRALMVETGLGNHPALVRFVLKVGKAMEDDHFIAGRNGGGSKQDLAHRMFPNLK